MFVCVLNVFRPNRVFFHLYGDVTTITRGKLQMLTYPRNSESLSSKAFLTCHTYPDIGR